MGMRDKKPDPRGLTDEISKGGMARTITCVSEVRTVDDALAYAEIDPAVWEVDRSVVNKWDMGYKNNDGEADTKGLWQVKVWLRRRARKGLTDALDAIHKRAEAYSPQYAPEQCVPYVEGGHLYMVSVYDAHFGKLAWREETGNNYDLRIAERLYDSAITDLLSYARGLPVSRICFPVGQDFLHVDNITLTTQKGTPQGADTEGRYAKIVETAFMALVKAIERMVSLAPVDVVLVQGNHDPTVSYHLCRELRAWFRHDGNVNVDCDFNSRKYYEWECALIGLNHGEECPDNRLVNLMATERPQAWARTTCHEWHKGHLHKRKTVQHTAVDSFEGLVVRTLPSLSARDAWHYAKGYVGNRAAEAYVYHETRGFVGLFATDARVEEAEE
jgi:hypothetical protein